MKRLLISFLLLAVAAPVNAELSAREKKAIRHSYHYGYNWGAVATGCALYAVGEIDRDMFESIVEVTRDDEDILPASKRRIVKNVKTMAEKKPKTALCLPIVRSVLGPGGY